MAIALFISEEKLKQNSLINENVDAKIITPLLPMVQDMYIQPAIGSGLYNELISQINSNSLTTLNETLIINYIQPAIIWWIMTEAPISMTYKFRNKGVQTQNSENSNPASIEDLISVADKYKYKAEWYTKRISNFLYANSTTYPLFLNAGTAYDTIHSNNQIYQAGMMLDDDGIDMSSLEYNQKFLRGNGSPYRTDFGFLL